MGSPDMPLAPLDLEQAGHPVSTASVLQEDSNDEEAGLLRHGTGTGAPQ